MSIFRVRQSKEFGEDIAEIKEELLKIPPSANRAIEDLRGDLNKLVNTAIKREGDIMTGPLQVPSMRATGEVAIGAAPAASGAIRLSNSQWIASRNAAGNADINIVRVNASDQVELGAGVVTPGPVAVGTNPAQSGVIRIPNNQWITARNAAGSGDVNVIRLSSSNQVEAGANLVVGSNVLETSNPPTNSAAAILLMNLGGTIVTRRVEVGAADSGGTGYRVLRVAN